MLSFLLHVDLLEKFWPTNLCNYNLLFSILDLVFFFSLRKMINLVPKMACCCLGYFPRILWKGLDSGSKGWKGESAGVWATLIFNIICLDFFFLLHGGKIGNCLWKLTIHLHLLTEHGSISLIKIVLPSFARKPLWKCQACSKDFICLFDFVPVLVSCSDTQHKYTYLLVDAIAY